MFMLKDLDALRFRAPSEINKIILKLSQEFNYSVADVYRVFNESSPGGITGNNLMTDHLHPDLHGYQILGKTVFDVMETQNLLPAGKLVPNTHSDSLAVRNFYFSSLDSTIARYRIIILKNDWPFSESRTAAYIVKQFNVQNAIDSIAVKVINDQISWEQAHRMAAKIHLSKGDYYSFSRDMLVLMDQFPYIDGFFTSTTETLLENKQYDLALECLFKKIRYSPDAFSLKWIGIIALSKYNDKEAVIYLKESLKYRSDDAQVLFNLAGAYSMSYDFGKALETIIKCLQVDPQFPGASQLKAQLETAAAAKK